MKNFNIFEPVLENAQKYGKNLFLLGKKGDLFTLYNETSRFKGDKQATNGSVLIYDKSTQSLDWKMVYLNSKGLYFKKNKVYYIK